MTLLVKKKKTNGAICMQIYSYLFRAGKTAKKKIKVKKMKQCQCDNSYVIKSVYCVFLTTNSKFSIAKNSSKSSFHIVDS